MKNALDFIKRETVLCAAVLLAVCSAFAVPPDGAYIGYIDWNTLLLMFALMTVMACLQKQGLFARAGAALLGKTHGTRGMLAVLVFLPFFLSMLITNDVALITFVPLGITVLRLSGREKLVLPLAVLQTLAANLGSMLTPMGNPQNLYLYACSGMGAGEFMLLMLPYTLLSGVCLLVYLLFMKNEPVAGALPVNSDGSQDAQGAAKSKRTLAVCLIAFALCMLAVARVLHPAIPAAAVFLYFIIADRDVLKRVDYSLLGTFAGFFIFIGNMGRIEAFCTFLTGVLAGHETPVAVLSSQVLSNVPAALLLSGFTDNLRALITGANIGGLGTLIASMASLISYKQIAREYPPLKLKYLVWFTLANIAMLAALMGLWTIIG